MDNSKHDGDLEFDEVVAALAHVPKAEVDALEAARPKRKKRPSIKNPRLKKARKRG